MPLAEAVALTGPAADGKHKEPRMCTADRTIHQAPLDPQADRRAMEELAEWCRQFSPIVAIEVASAPESLFLEITGLSHLFGGERSLAEQVLRALGSRGLSARVAAADTFGAAWATAHFMECSPPCIIPPGQSLPWLRDLPIEALRLPDDVIDLLHPLGIYSIGQLEQLPRADLAARFGSCLTERWDQAVGRQAEPIPAQQSPPELEAKQSLEYATTQREAVEFILDQLIRRVAEMLSRCGRGAARLDCRLDCRPAGCVDLSVGLFQATASARHLAELARLRLERISLPGPVQAISVAASATALLEHRQEELFADGPPRQRLRLLAALVDRLASRMGRRSVLRPRLVPDAQPESAYRYDLLLEVGAKREKGKKRGSDSERERAREEEKLLPRPLRLLPEPVPLAPLAVIYHTREEVADVRSIGFSRNPGEEPPKGGTTNRVEGDRPIFERKLGQSPGFLPGFRSRGREYRVAHAWGPERIETGWWRGAMIARDYYRIETVTGQRFWFFRRLDDNRWFLHGVFE